MDLVTEFEPAGDRVVVRIDWRAGGHGPSLQWEVSHVYTVGNGRIVRLDMFWEHADARAAAGLET